MKKGWMAITTKALAPTRAFSPYITKTTKHNSTENPAKQQELFAPGAVLTESKKLQQEFVAHCQQEMILRQVEDLLVLVV